ncbi:MAG: VWA-like domain-containing protein [Spirochaetaceae bacterium]|jgi:predicted metal-dependent peptidase|nr:VWA-like domain-containing protein [Spirochaetaceae bacterium]
MANAAERIKAISEKWFITEPLLFLTLVSHKLLENAGTYSIRCGQGRIEYNPLWAAERNDIRLEEALKAELVRILLRHPYRKSPSNDAEISYIASNIVLNEHYSFPELKFCSKDFWNDAGHRKKSFEFYYREYALIKRLDDSGGEEGGGVMAVSDEEMRGAATDRRGARDDVLENAALWGAALWGNDEFINEKLNEIVRQAEQNAFWGRLPGALIEEIRAAQKPELDWRAVLSGFRRTVIAEKKVPTRFKPSRRWGFMYMGQKYAFTTRILAGIDVSGSIEKEDISLFYSCVNRFFRYGIEALDAVQFDSELKTEPLPLKKARLSIVIHGRGGTNYQPLIDYFSDNAAHYDGLIIFTDGFAAVPTVPPRAARKLLWICNGKENYFSNHEWMEKLGRCCYIMPGGG